MSQVAIDHRDLATVLALALETEDRTGAESRVLARVAGRLDQARNLMTTGSQNSRVAQPVEVVPCTYSDHHAKSMRAAQALGVETCRCYGDRVVPGFTDEAKAEPLVDQHGWSRAREAVDP